MRPWVAVLTIVSCLLAAGCSVRNETTPGTPCDPFDTCGSPLVCVNDKCATLCTFVGDCDPGFVCVDKICLPRCESEADCVDQPCSPSDALGASYCGSSTSPVCASDAECPVGWSCERNGPLGRCVETCSRDADCPPNEACVDAFGSPQCRFGERPGDFEGGEMPDAGTDAEIPSNNPVIDRNCSNRPDRWCAEQFGANEVCFQGMCRLAPSTLVVFDLSEGSACDATLGDLDAGGSDIVAISDQSETGLWANVVDVVDGAGARTDSMVSLVPTPVCADPSEIFSIGCGGWLTLTTRDPLLEGSIVTVAEYDASCGDTADDRYEVRACTDSRAVTLARDLTSCTAVIGQAQGTSLFVVSY